MFDLQVCRGCLAVNGKLQKLGPTYERMFNNLTGLMLNKRDGYPKYFCWECKLQIRKSLMFARKVKRANFVLKEIMTVRDQIAFDDVIKVDRSKTNLDSSIGYWKTDKIERNALYQIEGTDETVDTSEDGTRPNDGMQPQKYDRNELLTCKIIDIEPVIEIDDDMQQTMEQSSVDNQDVTDDIAEDVTDDALVHTEHDKTTIPEDIDMEDVFKGLEEKQEESEDDDNLEDLFPPKHKKRKEKRTHRIPRSNIAYATLGKEKSAWIFLNVDMTVLDYSQQVERFQLRLQEPAFAKALYKCGLCVMRFPSLQVLVTHVQHHNAQKDYKFECNVCRDRFKVKDFLDMHVMDTHLYQYTCRLCDDNVVCYSLEDLMSHFKRHPMPSQQRLAPGERESWLGSFRVTLMRPEEVPPAAAPGERHVYHRKGRCELCRVVLAPDVINGHMLARHGVTDFKAFQCEHCKLYFLKLGSLRRHLREWHTFRYMCRKCKEEFYSMSLAKIHAKKCDAPFFDDNSLLCSDCGKMCKNQTGLAAHRRIVHQMNSQEHCVICGRPYLNREALIRHQIERHHYVSLNHPLVGDTRYQCKRCAVTFLFEQAYHVHLYMMGHDEAKELDMGCFSCRVYFKNNDQRAAHACGTAAVNSCPHCEVVLNKAAALREHVLSAHPGAQLSGSFVAGRRLCDVCGKHVQPSIFKAHMAAHTELAATLACPRCPLVAPSVAQLAEHVLGAHADRPFVCAICGERFQKKYILSNHLRKIHIKLLCEICNRRFKRPKLLEMHMRVIHQMEYKLELKTLKKTSSKLVIHRDMRVDVSLLSDSVVDQLKLEVIDYLDKSPIKVSDKCQYLFKEENPKSFLVAPTDGKKKKSKIRKTKKSPLKTEEGDVQIERTDRVEHIEQTAAKSEHNSDGELSGDETKEAVTKEEVKSGDGVESEMYEVDDMDMATSEEVVVQDGTQLMVDEENIMEIDGQRMININGVLYKFEDEV